MTGTGNNGIGISILITNHNVDCRKLMTDLHGQMCRWGGKGEIIVIDDCSSERELTCRNIEVAESLTGTTYLVNNSNKGAAVCRNMLADRALGEWFIFIDSDAEVTHDEFVANYWKHRHVADILVGGLFHPQANPNPDATLRFKYEREADRKRNARERNLNPYACFTAFNIMARRKVFGKVRFDESCKEYGYEDALFGVELKNKGISIYHIDNALMHTGLDTNESFLRKTDVSLKTLAKLRMEGKMEGESRVGNMADKVEMWGLSGMARMMFRMTKGLLLRNLKGHHPNLLLFSVYKLLKFLSVRKEMETRI